jgi:hypothetical protein
MGSYASVETRCHDMLNWLLGKRFEPPSAPLKDFWVTVHVRLAEPHVVEDHPPADAYLRMFGLRCTPIRLQSLLAEQVTDGSIIRDDDTHWHEVSLNELSRSLRAAVSVQDSECVWHVSGRIYFSSALGSA